MYLFKCVYSIFCSPLIFTPSNKCRNNIMNTMMQMMKNENCNVFCRYPRTGVPPLAVSRQRSCSYPKLHPNSRTPAVRSPVLPTTVSDLFHGWERSRNTTCPGRGRRSARTAGGSGPPVEVRIPAESRTPHGVSDPCIVTGPLAKGRNRHPASGWSGAATCLQAQTRM